MIFKDSSDMHPLEEAMNKYGIQFEKKNDQYRVKYNSQLFVLDGSSMRKARKDIQLTIRNLKSDVDREEKNGTAYSNCGLSLKRDSLALWQGILQDIK